MDKQKFDEELDKVKKSLKSNQILIVRDPVVDELGEVVYDGKISVVTEVFPDIPYRTPRDLKGYDDTVLNTDPSLLDLTNYVDNRDMIARLMQTFPASVLADMAEAHTKDDYDFSDVDVDDIDQFDESDEPLDNITYLSNKSQQDLIDLQKTLQKSKDEGASLGKEERSDDEPKQANLDED